MKIKTAELIGSALDWAVAKCLGLNPTSTHIFNATWPDGLELEFYRPSTEGADVIGIMEWERISAFDEGSSFSACYSRGKRAAQRWSGPTLRIAVCRCFVAAKLGDEVDVPEEILK